MRYMFHDIAVKLFLNIDNYKNSGRLAYGLGVTYSHTVNILKVLVEEGLITREKVGREKIMKYTEKGQEIRKNLSDIKVILYG